MSFTPKQKKIMIWVLALAYIYFFYSYNWNDAIPGILQSREISADINEELAKLEEQLANIEQTKSELESMKAADERYKDFIDESMGIQPAIDYVDTLIHVLNKSVCGVSISSPSREIRTEPNYYQTSISFNSVLKYDELMDFVEFIEGGNKPVRITSLRVMPESLSLDEREMLAFSPSIYTEDWDLNVAIDLTMYSLDKESAENFYEVSRNKLERFGYFDGISFVIPDNIFPDSDSTTINFGGSQEPPPTGTVRPGRDFFISLGSFLAGGRNFIFDGITPNNEESIRYRTREPQNIVLRVERHVYHVEVSDGSSGVQNFTGATTGNDLNLEILATVPDITENQNLAIDLTIINRSDNNIIISKNKDSNRVRIYDSNNNLVITRSHTDKIFMR